MSEITPNSKGPAPVQYTPAASEPTLIPADQVKPEDIGTLSLRYVDGAPQLVVSGGKYLPAGLAVVDASGSAVATYTAGSDLAPSLIDVPLGPVPYRWNAESDVR
ncbi:hypothetical protein [Streptomyces sp. NPDC056069]|uniref:hypothetical protein n=1 Tax=Streptomyces sp. NPDC056069 TaxID=3345702 RepID=UPI0035E060FC